MENSPKIDGELLEVRKICDATLFFFLVSPEVLLNHVRENEYYHFLFIDEHEDGEFYGVTKSRTSFIRYVKRLKEKQNIVIVPEENTIKLNRKIIPNI